MILAMRFFLSGVALNHVGAGCAMFSFFFSEVSILGFSAGKLPITTILNLAILLLSYIFFFAVKCFPWRLITNVTMHIRKEVKKS